MPWQLIYTSAPRGLLSGHTGFCTVARSADLREAVAQRLEQMSSYHYIRVAEAATANRNPTVSAFRLLDFRGAKYYVLTRIQPCGLDFTARTNHLAHHLIFQPDEVSGLPSPAAILRFWPGWLSSWQGEPRLLDSIDTSGFAAAAKNCLPARTWTQVTGDGGRAAGLLELHGTYLSCPPDSQELVLAMYCETLQLLNSNGQTPLRPWRHTFTNFLQAEDNPNDFEWRACQENAPAHKQAMAKSAQLIALRSIRVPPNSLVKLAREDAKAQALPSAPPKAAAAEVKAADAGKPLSLLPKQESTGNYAPQLTLPRPGPPPPKREGLQVSISRATILSVGIVIIVLAVLFWVKRRSSHATVEPPVAEPVAAAPDQPHIKTENPTPPEPVVQDDSALDQFVAGGPTFIIVAKDASNVSVTNSIKPLLRLLNRYKYLDTSPGNIMLEAASDQWINVQGEPMTVQGYKADSFRAAGSGFSCTLGFDAYIASPPGPLKIEAAGIVGSYFLHFQFKPAETNCDPFRLVIISENNPPMPVRLPARYIRIDKDNHNAGLQDSVRASVERNFHLMGGRQWQLHPYVPAAGTNSQYLYKDWPPDDVPAFGHELDYASVRENLRRQVDSLQGRFDQQCQPLGMPLGKLLNETNGNLASYFAYASNEVTVALYSNYLSAIKAAAPPDRAWLKKMRADFDASQPDEVVSNLQKIYGAWSERRSQSLAATNYLEAAWQIVADAGGLRARMDDVKRRLAQLDKVSYIALGIVDPRQPKPGLEMIRFEGP